MKNCLENLFQIVKCLTEGDQKNHENQNCLHLWIEMSDWFILMGTWQDRFILRFNSIQLYLDATDTWDIFVNCPMSDDFLKSWEISVRWMWTWFSIFWINYQHFFLWFIFFLIAFQFGSLEQTVTKSAQFFRVLNRYQGIAARAPNRDGYPEPC